MSFVAQAEFTDNKIIFSEIYDTASSSSDFSIDIKRGIHLAIKEASVNQEFEKRTIELYNNSPKTFTQKNRFISFLGVNFSGELSPLNLADDQESVNMFGSFIYEAKPAKKPSVNIFNLNVISLKDRKEWIRSLINEHQVKKIIILSTKAEEKIISELKADLQKQNLEIIAVIKPGSNTLTTKTEIMKIKNLAVDLLLIVDSSYNELNKFMSLSRNLGLNIPFTLLKTSKSTNKKNKNSTKDYIIPSPYDTNLQIAIDYNKALKDLDPEHSPSLAGLSGYIIGRASLYVTKQIDGEINSENFAIAAKKIKNFELGGLKIGLSSTPTKDSFFSAIYKEYNTTK